MQAEISLKHAENTCKDEKHDRVSLTNRKISARRFTPLTEEVKKNTRHVLNSLITIQQGDGRIWIQDIAENMDAEHFELRQDELRRWLSGRGCPKAKTLWMLGNTLRDHGCPWCSGFWLLWACNRYAECLQIIRILCHLRPPVTAKKFFALKAMISAAPALCEATIFERGVSEKGDFTVWPQYVSKMHLDETTLEHLQEYAIAAQGEGWADLDAGAPAAIAKDLATVVRREAAKVAWLAYDALYSDIIVSGKDFFDSSKSVERDPCDLPVEAAIAAVLNGAGTADELSMLATDVALRYIAETHERIYPYTGRFNEIQYDFLNSDFATAIRALWCGQSDMYEYYRDDLLDQIHVAVERISAIEDDDEEADGKVVFS